MVNYLIHYLIHYLRDQKGQPLACIAFNDYHNPYEDANIRTVEYAISILNPKDCFNRKLARTIAIGRLVESPSKTAIIYHEKSPNINDLLTRILLEISSDKSLPTRISRRASQIIKNCFYRFKQ